MCHARMGCAPTNVVFPTPCLFDRPRLQTWRRRPASSTRWESAVRCVTAALQGQAQVGTPLDHCGALSSEPLCCVAPCHSSLPPSAVSLHPKAGGEPAQGAGGQGPAHRRAEGEGGVFALWPCEHPRCVTHSAEAMRAAAAVVMQAVAADAGIKFGAWVHVCACELSMWRDPAGDVVRGCTNSGASGWIVLLPPLPTSSTIA